MVKKSINQFGQLSQYNQNIQQSVKTMKKLVNQTVTI